MKKLICVVATIGVLMSLTAIPVSAGFGFDRWPTVQTRYQGSTLCNQTLAKNCYTEDYSQLISVGLRKGDSVKASTNKKLYGSDDPIDIRSGFLETSLGYNNWNVSGYWR